MIGLLVPLLVGDAVLFWMLVVTHRKRDRSRGAQFRGHDVNRMLHWATFGRLLLLFALSMLGTIAVLRD